MDPRCCEYCILHILTCRFRASSIDWYLSRRSSGVQRSPSLSSESRSLMSSLTVRSSVFLLATVRTNFVTPNIRCGHQRQQHCDTNCAINRRYCYHKGHVLKLCTLEYVRSTQQCVYTTEYEHQTYGLLRADVLLQLAPTSTYVFVLTVI